MVSAASLDLSGLISLSNSAGADSGSAALDLRPGQVVWAEALRAPSSSDRSSAIVIQGKVIQANLPADVKDGERLKLQVVVTESGDKALRILQTQNDPAPAGDTERALEEILQALGTDLPELDILKTALRSSPPPSSDLSVFSKIQNQSQAVNDLLNALVPLNDEQDVSPAEIARSLSAPAKTAEQLLLRVLQEAFPQQSESTGSESTSGAAGERLRAVLNLFSAADSNTAGRPQLTTLVTAHLGSLAGTESSLQNLLGTATRSSDAALLPVMLRSLERTLSQSAGEHENLLSFVRDFGRQLQDLSRAGVPDEAIRLKLEDGAKQLETLLKTPGVRSLPEPVRVQLASFQNLLEQLSEKNVPVPRAPISANNSSVPGAAVDRLIQTLKDLGIADVESPQALQLRLLQLTRAQIETLKEPEVRSLVETGQDTPVERVLRFVKNLEQRLDDAKPSGGRPLLKAVDDIKTALEAAQKRNASPAEFKQLISESIKTLEKAFPRIAETQPKDSESGDAERLAKLLYAQLSDTERSLDASSSGSSVLKPQLAQVFKAVAALEKSLEKTVELEKQVVALVRDVGARLEDSAKSPSPDAGAKVFQESLKNLRALIVASGDSGGNTVLPKQFLQAARALEGQLLAALTANEKAPAAPQRNPSTADETTRQTAEKILASVRESSSQLIVALSDRESAGDQENPGAQLQKQLQILVQLLDDADRPRTAALPASQSPEQRTVESLKTTLTNLRTVLDEAATGEPQASADLPPKLIQSARGIEGQLLAVIELHNDSSASPKDLAALVSSIKKTADQLSDVPSPAARELAEALRKTAAVLSTPDTLRTPALVTQQLTDLLQTIRAITEKTGAGGKPELPVPVVGNLSVDLEKVLKSITDQIKGFLAAFQPGTEQPKLGNVFQGQGLNFELLLHDIQPSSTPGAKPPAEQKATAQPTPAANREQPRAERLTTEAAPLVQRTVTTTGLDRAPVVAERPQAQASGPQAPIVRPTAPQTTPVATPLEVKQFTELKQQLGDLLSSIRKPVAVPINGKTPAPERSADRIAADQTRTEILAGLTGDREVPELLEVLRKIDERSSFSASRTEQRIFQLAKEIAHRVETGGLRKESSQDAGGLDHSVSQLQQLLSFAVEKNRASNSTAAFRDALRGLENIIRGQDVLQKLNPIFQALGEPAFILFPHLLQGMISKVELSYVPAELRTGRGPDGEREPVEEDHERIDPDEKRKRERQKQEGFERVKLQLTLPSLGEVGVDFARTLNEIILTITTGDRHAGEFLEESLPDLNATLSALGYRNISLRTIFGPVKVIRPDWVEQITQQKEVAA